MRSFGGVACGSLFAKDGAGLEALTLLDVDGIEVGVDQLEWFACLGVDVLGCYQEAVASFLLTDFDNFSWQESRELLVLKIEVDPSLLVRVAPARPLVADGGDIGLAEVGRPTHCAGATHDVSRTHPL